MKLFWLYLLILIIWLRGPIHQLLESIRVLIKLNKKITNKMSSDQPECQHTAICSKFYFSINFLSTSIISNEHMKNGLIL